MHKFIQLIVSLLLVTQFASAQERQIKILNPDGTPAMDAKAIAIKTIGVAMPMVDTNLELLPKNVRGLPADTTSMTRLENDNGTVLLLADAKGIVASNDIGFVFLPADAEVETAQLRSWATVKIDTSSIPEAMKDKLWMRISWTNNFCGIYPGNGMMAGSGIPTAKKDPSPDWRFDPFVHWCRDVKVSENNEAFKVPPGEISVMLTDRDMKQVQSTHVSYHMVCEKTASNKTTEIVFPKFGSLRGTLVAANRTGLPDWGQLGKTRIGTVPLNSMSPAIDDLHRRFGNIATPNAINFNDKPFVDPTAQGWNHYAEFLSTDAGFSVRTSGLRSSTTEVEADGSFLFPLVPVGECTLTRWTPVALPSESSSTTGEISKPVGLAFNVEGILQSGDQQRTPMKVTVKENECLDLGKLDATSGATSQTVTYSPLPDANPRPGAIVIVEQHVVRDGKTESIKTAHVVTEDGSRRVATTEDLEMAAAAGIPISDANLRTIQPGEIIGSTPDASPTATGDTVVFEPDVVQDGRIVKHIVPQRVFPAGNAPLYQPGTFSNDVNQTQPDAAAGIIEQWLKTAGKDADREELRALLQKHLESEFDANQKSRQAEVERLQQLLGKSKEWLNKRQERRDEIIEKRIDELLRQQELSKPGESSLRR